MSRRTILISGLAGSLLLAQSNANFSKPRLGGMAIASEFAHWQAQAAGPVMGSGAQETVPLQTAQFTLPDGTPFLPLAVGSPLAVEGDANPETVTPTAVDCSVGGGICTVTAAFSKPHSGHFFFSTATLGIQEAVNSQANPGGGIVLADAGLRGVVSGVLGLVQLPSNVLLVDTTSGNWDFYNAGPGAHPQSIGGFSSRTGLNLGPLSTLNGVVFASQANFPAVLPATPLTAQVPATITPNWSQIPAGLVVGNSIYIANGSGSPEAVAVQNIGAACPGGGVLSLCFTPANSHSGAWSLQSATAGLQEALNLAGAGGWVVDDEAVATIYAPIVIGQTVRLSGFSDFDDNTGTRIQQSSANTDVIEIGSASLSPSDVAIENLMAVGVNGSGADLGVAFHCVSCVRLKLTNVTGKQAHDGLFFDSAYGHAYTPTVTGSHFIGNYYGVHIVGASANRLTFVGNTIDGNAYGVFDDGGWVHTWVGNDFESNSLYGYWQQVSQPAAYSGHNLLLHGNYFESNGSNTTGQGDLFIGQLVAGGTGNNGDGCDGCDIADNIFNASLGGNVTAISFGAVNATVSDNAYSGYGAGKQYAYITGPDPNFSHVLSLGDGANGGFTASATGAFGGAAPGTLTRIDPNGTLTLGGWDQLNDPHGTRLKDTTLESPTGVVSIRGLPGGAATSNPAQLNLEGNSTAIRGNQINFRNGGTTEYQLLNDPFGANSHDFCLNDLAVPTAAQCIIYANPQGKLKFGNPGPSGTLSSRTQDYQFSQVTDGDSALVINRKLDSSPTGYLIDLEDSTLSHPLFRVDVTGTVVAGGWNNSTSAFTIGPLSATTGAFSGAIAAAAGSTVGGNPINTAPPPIAGQTTGLFTSSSFGAGTCQAAGLAFSSGVTIGMAVAVNPETTPPAGLVWNGVIDALNHVTVRVCNATSATVAWSSGSVWDIRVLP